MKYILARLAAPFAWSWHYRPTTMRPAMRKRTVFGFEQCQVYSGGKWVKAQHPASRYQWKPLTRKTPAGPVKLDLA